MKTTLNSVAGLAIFAIVLIVSGSCSWVLGARTTGSIVISSDSPPGAALSIGSSPKTIRPVDSALQIATYHYDLAGPNGATASLSTPSASATFTALAIGDWTVAATAYNGSSVALLSGSSPFTVRAGENTGVTVILAARAGTGTAKLTLNLPSAITAIDGTIQREAAGSSATAIASSQLALASSVATYTDTLEAGTYRLILNLRNAEGVAVGGIIDALDVFSGIETARTLTVTEAMITDKPAAPASLSATAGDGKVTLWWASVLGATGYNVYYKAGSASATKADTKAPGSPFASLDTVVSGLTNGTQYGFCVTAINYAGEGPESPSATATPQGTTVPAGRTVSHLNIAIDDVPASAINAAKASLYVYYARSSHGGQLISGMNGLDAFKGDTGLYDYSNIYEVWNDAGYFPECRDETVAYLGPVNGSGLGSAHPEVKVVMWAWCGQLSGLTTDVLEAEYLYPLDELERTYTGITFVYFTGHLDGNGLDGTLQRNNETIRDWCAAGNRWLYDFADIETYDPDGKYFGDRFPTDACNYDYNGSGNTTQSATDPALPIDGDRNWALDWQDANPGKWYACLPAHTQDVNGNMKAYAAWWLFARIAGWDGP